MGFLSSFIERVIHIQLYGNVNLRMTENLLQALKNKHLYSVKLIAVSINSRGGSIVQAKNVNNILRAFSKKTQAPIYTFSESMAWNAANIILTGGDKCYANKYSLLGDFGFFNRKLQFKDFARDWNIQGEYISAGKEKIKFNPFDDFKEEDSKWLQEILYGMEYELKAEIIKNRNEHFQRHSFTNETLEKELFEPAFLTPENALKYGFIDGITTLHTFLDEKYEGVKRLDVMKRSRFEDRVPKSEANVLTDLLHINAK